MEQLTKNQAVATSQEAVQNQNEPQLRDENAHNDKSVHGVLNPAYQAGLRRDAVQPDIEADRKKDRRASWREQTIHLAKNRPTRLLLNAPLIAVGTLIAVVLGTFRLRNNP